ncbi:MAG: SDR family NAD(P)-dependent oxidoreductase [Ignavibacteriaceae bacterium]|nr:SDR family NAD(P)-dependent oxidoreductase [Ignavibacteriaceae bacterium]
MKKELIIFGSNGALGKGVTETLLSKDYDKIYLFDFHPLKIEGKNISQFEIKDLSIEKNVKNAFAKVQASKNTAYLLFSTVGGFAGGKTVWETSVDEWDKMMDMNLKTSFLIAKHFSELVKNSHSGSVCFTAAYTGLHPEKQKAAYGTSKAAIIYLVKTIAQEGREIKLTANGIAPYIIDTPANREWMKDSNYESWMKPQEIGEFVHSVFSNYNFITGNIFKLTNRFSVK